MSNTQILPWQTRPILDRRVSEGFGSGLFVLFVLMNTALQDFEDGFQ